MLMPSGYGESAMRSVWVSRALSTLATAMTLVAMSVLLMATVPVGAIGASIGWLWSLGLMCAGFLACGPLGRALLTLIWIPSLGPTVRRKRVRVASFLVIGLAASVNWADPMPILPPAHAPGNYAPPCYLIPAVTHSIENVSRNLLVGLMGHGRRPRNDLPVCVERQIVSPRHGLPWMIGAVLLVALWSRHWNLEEEERRAAQAERLASLKHNDRNANVAVAHTGSETDSPPDHQPSAADRGRPSAAPIQRVVRQKQTLGSALHSLAAYVREWLDRAPLIATALAVYLGGGALTVLGFEWPLLLARAATPNALLHHSLDWPVLGLWLACATAAALGLVSWARQRYG